MISITMRTTIQHRTNPSIFHHQIIFGILLIISFHFWVEAWRFVISAFLFLLLSAVWFPRVTTMFWIFFSGMAKLPIRTTCLPLLPFFHTSTLPCDCLFHWLQLEYWAEKPMRLGPLQHLDQAWRGLIDYIAWAVIHNFWVSKLARSRYWLEAFGFHRVAVWRHSRIAKGSEGFSTIFDNNFYRFIDSDNSTV